ncbi:hypothetical protein COCC4DRAFT_51182 [Bipolaris maydis ATCC 48331]|uniref:Uncharacterized protein n=1 Tax=Cochliobolus heterostrophus (strain C4 / ATCC 48331 / race T) TaxID=665024 RepID=N4XD04_COCH4|nr:uncharacterized protein COCC4DRAFT_51182 [Bipolaris maydis ATCC 48331]ENI04441.1 hypothetical protein COCC4DRAFT_51182 [Bipolaris maydis ATCC 48331]
MASIEVVNDEARREFTIATLECGHPQEDHVDTYGCPYFQRSNLHCDRDNPNNKDRFTIKTWDREGICNRCLSVARKREEEAIEREQKKYDEQRRREAKEREEELRRGEREVLERGHRQEEERLAEKKRREEALRAQERQKWASEERTREVERKSKEEYERQIQLQMDKDMEYMMAKSREEAERREREEEEEIQRALAESARLIRSERSYQEDQMSSGSREQSGGRIESWIESTSRTTTTTTINNHSSGNNHSNSYNSNHNNSSSSHNSNSNYPQKSSSPPSPPATPPTRKATSPPPPPPLPVTAPVNKSAARAPPPPPPAPKPAGQAKEINYSLPAVGDQKIGRFRLGSRAVPVHESQDIPETPITPAKPIAPSTPAPMVRLGGAIPVSDVPIVREIKGQVKPVPSAMENARPALPFRKPSVSRKGPPPPVPNRDGRDPQLEAMLAKRRAWEPEEDEGATITPPRSPSKGQTPPARRMTQNEFDTKRKMGWKNNEDE